jgi:hypothetical protein
VHMRARTHTHIHTHPHNYNERVSRHEEAHQITGRGASKKGTKKWMPASNLTNTTTWHSHKGMQIVSKRTGHARRQGGDGGRGRRTHRR